MGANGSSRISGIRFSFGGTGDKMDKESRILTNDLKTSKRDITEGSVILSRKSSMQAHGDLEFADHQGRLQ